jgi:cyclic pyranopterin phosphate synthase
MSTFTHLDEHGHARMVDVSKKMPTQRVAVARSEVFFGAPLGDLLSSSSQAIDDVLISARVAAMLAAKRTSAIIPLCHPLLVAPVQIDFVVDAGQVTITCISRTYERTGVEMEALVGCSVAALSIFAAWKKLDEDLSIGGIALWEKIGGKSGHWRRVDESLSKPAPTDNGMTDS